MKLRMSVGLASADNSPAGVGVEAAMRKTMSMPEAYPYALARD